jgi:hypothetical protein
LHAAPRGENFSLNGNASTPSTPTPATAEAPPYTATLAAIADDDTFCEDLLAWVRATRRLMPNPVPLEDADVITRLCRLPDARFTQTILALAQPDGLGLDILFDARLLERYAAIDRGHRRGSFLPALRRLTGFCERDWLYDIHHAPRKVTVVPWTIYTAAELLAMEFPPLQWVVESILPAGLTLFSGRGKDGKSMLVWNLCLAVASGGLALGRYGVMQGDVLYLDLEDGGRRAQERLKHVMKGLPEDGPQPASLDIVPLDAALVGQGLEEQLTGWLDQHPNARLIAVDILEKIRPKRQRGGSVYEDDYAALTTLQRLAQERNVAIIVVHHSNKSKYEDFRDSSSGSMGLIGVCDSFWGLSRVAGKPDAVLKITGREVEEQELAMQFAEGFWNVTGEAEDLRRSQAAITILDALRQAGGPQTVKELCATLEVPENVMRVRLCRMQQRGEVTALGEGRYALPTWTPTPTPGGITYMVPSDESPVMPVMPQEEAPAPVEETPVPLEEAQDMEESVVEDVPEQAAPAVELAAPEAGITPLTGLALQDTQEALILVHGYENGWANGVHGPASPAVNPVCPQCGRHACAPFGGTGRICMQCAYCERPLSR